MEAIQEIMVRRDLVRRRTGLKRQQDFLTRFLPGPAAIVVGVLATSMMMMPAADETLQSSFRLNTALILGFAYGWFGLAAYFAASVLGLVGSLRTERKRPVQGSAARERDSRGKSRGKSRATRNHRVHWRDDDVGLARRLD